jgi:hypothetical protein
MSATTTDPREDALKTLIAAMKRAGRNDSDENRRRLGEAILAFRATFTNKHGRPDVTGKTYEYREAYNDAREQANAYGDHWDKLFHAVRHYTGDGARNFIRDMAGGNDAKYAELCHEYGLKPNTANQRRVGQLAVQRALASNRTVGAGTVLALLERARDLLKEDLDAETAGAFPQRDMTSADAVKMRDVAAELGDLLPKVSAILAKHFPE